MFHEMPLKLYCYISERKISQCIVALTASVNKIFIDNFFSLQLKLNKLTLKPQ